MDNDYNMEYCGNYSSSDEEEDDIGNHTQILYNMVKQNKITDKCEYHLRQAIKEGKLIYPNILYSIYKHLGHKVFVILAYDKFSKISLCKLVDLLIKKRESFELTNKMLEIINTYGSMNTVIDYYELTRHQLSDYWIKCMLKKLIVTGYDYQKYVLMKIFCDDHMELNMQSMQENPEAWKRFIFRIDSTYHFKYFVNIFITALNEEGLGIQILYDNFSIIKSSYPYRDQYLCYKYECGPSVRTYQCTEDYICNLWFNTTIQIPEPIWGNNRYPKDRFLKKFLDYRISNSLAKKRPELFLDLMGVISKVEVLIKCWKFDFRCLLAYQKNMHAIQ